MWTSGFRKVETAQNISLAQYDWENFQFINFASDPALSEFCVSVTTDWTTNVSTVEPKPCETQLPHVCEISSKISIKN